jgi:hypothetical protein
MQALRCRIEASIDTPVQLQLLPFLST